MGKTKKAVEGNDNALIGLVAAGLRLQAIDSLWRVSGNTLPHRQLMRDQGGTWNRLDQCWEFAGADPTAKLAEALYNTVYLSDVGCTYRVLKRSVVDDMTPVFRGIGSTFGFEMMLIAARRKHSFVQVPVGYHPRVGVSSVTGSKVKAFVLGLQMIVMCLRLRVARYVRA